MQRIPGHPYRRLAALAGLALLAACAPVAPAGAPSPGPSCRADAGVSGAIRWVLPRERGDRDRLDRWCAAVGPPVVRRLPDAAPDPPVDSLAIVSWNAHVGGGDLVRLVRALRGGSLSGGQPVRHFVLLLQEVHRESAALPPVAAGGSVPARVEERTPAGERQDVVQVAREMGLALYYAPSMRNGRAAPGAEEDRGNAILSTLPLADLHAIELPFEAQRRVALAAAVQGRARDGSAWELLVATAHLDTRSTGARLWASAGAGRLRQAEGLVAGLPPGRPAVVAGDLNTWSLGPLEAAVPFLRSAFPQTPAAPDLATFAGAWGYRRRLDHMFFRVPNGWSARYRRLDDRYGSDHHPLLGWITVGPAGPG